MAEDSARRAIIASLAAALSAVEAALILADGREIVELGRLLDLVKRQKELAEERA